MSLQMGLVSVLFFPFLVSNNFRGKLGAHLLVFVHWVGWCWVVICRRMSKFQYKYINLSNCIRSSLRFGVPFQRDIFCLDPNSPQCLSIIPIVPVLLCLDKHHSLQCQWFQRMQTPTQLDQYFFIARFRCRRFWRKQTCVESVDFFIGTDDGGRLVRGYVRVTLSLYSSL